MSFEKVLPDWQAKGIEPPQSKREIGWEVEDRPPAAWLNWFMNLTAESLQELQTKAAEKTYVDGQISEAIKDIDVDISDASLTQKGIAMLSNATDGTRENVAATEKAVGLAFQAGNERKAEVVAALVSKGVAATTSETWVSLIAKLTALIKATGNAILADVLADKIFSTAAGNAMVGTMPDKRGVNIVSGSQYIKSLNVYPTNAFYAQMKIGSAEVGLIDSTTTIETHIYGLIPENIKGGQKIGEGVTMTGTFTNDATATAAQILNGYVSYGQGQRIVGTMAAYGADTEATACTATNGRLYMRPSAGYRGGMVSIYIDDPDFLPQNIRSGVDVFGMVGTMVEGKRTANARAYTNTTNGFTVTGLAFTPSFIYLRSYNTLTPIFAIYKGGTGYISTESSYYWNVVANNNVVISSSGITPVAGGFTFLQSQNLTYTNFDWVAFE